MFSVLSGDFMWCFCGVPPGIKDCRHNSIAGEKSAERSDFLNFPPSNSIMVEDQIEFSQVGLLN